MAEERPQQVSGALHIGVLFRASFHDGVHKVPESELDLVAEDDLAGVSLESILVEDLVVDAVVFEDLTKTRQFVDLAVAYNECTRQPR